MAMEKIAERVTRLDVAALCDAGKRTIRALDPAVRRIAGKSIMVGRARTVVCEGDFLAVIKALHDAVDGEVLVIDTRGTRRAVSGELFASEAKRKQLRGIVVDGFVRDTSALARIGLPVYARGTNPLAGFTVHTPIAYQVDINCGGITVSPGDWIIGDADGVIAAS